MSALDLAVRAAEEALDVAPGLRARVEQVSLVNVLSPVGAAPARHLAARTGLSPRRTEVTTVGGNSPQWLVSRAAAAIAAGQLQCALVAGAEAQHSGRRAAPEGPGARGVPGTAGGHDDGDVDPIVGDGRAPLGDAELAVGLVAPVHVYAMFENAIAGRAGRTPSEQRAVLGALMAPFSAVAAGHRAAWFPQARTAAELAAVHPGNRLVAEPYPKRMCAVLAVDQGAAVVVCSLAVARACGVADRAVFCWSGAEAADVWFPAARPDLASSPAIGAAATAALEAAGLGIDDIGAFDLYSCFPCAVEMAVEALGITAGDPRGLTVTGGLPYFGGPGNNYSLHAIATMADVLRARGGAGLVTAMGWYATKHAVGVYGSTPPARGWCRGDTTAAQSAIDAAALDVALEARGEAVVTASTVVYGRDGSVTAAPVVARLGDGRQVAAAAEPDQLEGLAGCNIVGDRIVVAGAPPRYRRVG